MDFLVHEELRQIGFDGCGLGCCRRAGVDQQCPDALEFTHTYDLPDLDVTRIWYDKDLIAATARIVLV